MAMQAQSQSQSHMISIPSIFSPSTKPFAGLALPNIAERALDKPLAITISKAQQIMSFLLPRIEGQVPIESDLLRLSESDEYNATMPSMSFADVARRNGVEVIPGNLDAYQFPDNSLAAQAQAQAQAQANAGTRARGASNQDLGFDLLPTSEGNIAVIPINGTLVQRGAYLRESSGMTSYQGIKTTINNALTDARVASLLMYVNSPGGEAYGLFELAKSIQLLTQSAGQPKPFFSFTDGVMASAAYALGSAASRIYTEEITTVGSIGVLMIHREKSKKNEMDGVSVTYITSGDQKADGNEDTPLAADVQARFQNRVDKIAGRFFQSVSAARQGADSKIALSVEAIAALQAGVFLGGEAHEKGLTDGVRSLRDVVDEMSLEMKTRKRGARTSITGPGALSAHTPAHTPAPAPAPASTQEEEDTKSIVVRTQDDTALRFNPNPGGTNIMTAQAVPLQVFDVNGNSVSLDTILAAAPQFAQMAETLQDLTTKLAERDASLDTQNARVTTLLVSQEQKDMIQLVKTQLRGLPLQVGHMTSMLLRLKQADPVLYGEFLSTFTVIARAFSTSNQIVTQRGRAATLDEQRGIITHVGEGAAGGRVEIDASTQTERFLSEDGTVILQLTPGIKAYNNAMHKIVAERGVTELEAIELISKEQPELLAAAKADNNERSFGPSEIVDEQHGADLGTSMAAPVSAGHGSGPGPDPAVDAPQITATHITNPDDAPLAGALAGPDVREFLNQLPANGA